MEADKMTLSTRTVSAAGYIFVFIVFALILCAWRPSPPDDFLRHVRYMDYAPHGGYSYMFPDSYFEQFTWDPWYGFDHLAGIVKAWIGTDKTILLFQVVSLWLFLAGMIINLQNRSEHFLLHLTFLSFLLSLLVNRLILIRPCIFLAIIFFLSIKGRRFLTGFLTSVICAVLYYLFFLYTVPLILAHYLRGSKRFSFGMAAGTILSIAGWLLFTDFGLVSILWHTLNALLFSRQGLVIAENTLSVDQLERPAVYLIVFLFLATLYRRRGTDIYTILLLSTAPLALQARYFVDLSLPLMVLYLLRRNGQMTVFFLRNRPVFEALALVSILLVIPGIRNVSVKSPYTARLDGLDLPTGSTVFCADGMPNNFSAVFWNKNLIRVLPSSEIGWNDKETLEVIKYITAARTISEDFCGYARKYRINYVLSERPSSAPCFSLLLSAMKSAKSSMSIFSSWLAAPYSPVIT